MSTAPNKDNAFYVQEKFNFQCMKMEGIKRIKLCGPESMVDPLRIVAWNHYCILSILTENTTTGKNNTQIKAGLYAN